MAYILGIDTGGTYTDSVLYDESANKILAKSKSLTTYENLVTGIQNSIKMLDISSDVRISGISLSTTLATNAIVEGRGCDVGTILIGHEMIDKLPGNFNRVVPGGHDINGDEKEPLDFTLLEKAVEELSPKVETFSVSSYFSVRNPEHEIKARDFIRKMTGKPVVCGYELTSKLGFHERAVTAALNAKILPTIETLIKSVRNVLNQLNIKAPLMIVKGDGSLMDESTAMVKPIETILSGPASSIIGARKLTNLKDALIVDIGGTTTDIALIKNNIPKIDLAGAKVGGWHTRVKSARINTYGIGGDSLVRIKALDDITVGPEKVIPFSEAGQSFDYLADEIKNYYIDSLTHRFTSIEGYKLVKNIPENLNEAESEIFEILRQGAHTYNYLARNLGDRFSRIYLKNLEKKGYIKTIALTPTDLLHAAGSFTIYNPETSIAVLDILADRFDSSRDKLIDILFTETIKKISMSVIESAMDYDGENLKGNESNSKFFLNKMLESENSTSSFNVSCSFNTPIVAIGAPVGAYMPRVSEILNSNLHIPENADVANALGAASGNIYEKISIIINTNGKGGIVLHAPWGRELHDDVEKAKTRAIEMGSEHLMKISSVMDIENINIYKDIHDIYAGHSIIEGENVFIESNIELSLSGKPSWE